jgi:hypothetical protein
MADGKLVELAKLIYDRTRSGELVWEKTTDPGIFQASFPKYAVTIRMIRGDGVLHLFNDKGEMIESLSDTIPFRTQEGDDKFLLDVIFELARRRAMGVDQAIEELLLELKKK